MPKPTTGKGKASLRYENLVEMPYVGHSHHFKRWVKNQLSRYRRRIEKTGIRQYSPH